MYYSKLTVARTCAVARDLVLVMVWKLYVPTLSKTIPKHVGGTCKMSYKPSYAVKIDPNVQRMAKIQFMLSCLNTDLKLTDVYRNNPRVAFLPSRASGGKVSFVLLVITDWVPA